MPKLTSKQTDQSGLQANKAEIAHRSRARVTRAFIGCLDRDFQRHGARVIEIVRETRPVAYLNMITSLIPRETKISGNINITGIIQDIEARNINTLDNDQSSDSTIDADYTDITPHQDNNEE